MRVRACAPVFAVCLALAGGALFAEGKDNTADLISPASEFPSAVGLFGSMMHGGGLSYQRWLGSFGLALTAGGMAYPGGSYYSLVNAADPATDFLTWSYNAELDLLYRLYASNFWNWLSGDLFVYLTLAHSGGVSAMYVDRDGDPSTAEDWYYTPSAFQPVVAAGFGIGYEIVLFRHFSFPLQFGYVAEWPFQMNLNVSGGIRYRF